MLGRLAWLLVGVYGGIYINQHYKIPVAEDPKQLYERMLEMTKKYKKEIPAVEDPKQLYERMLELTEKYEKEANKPKDS